jgi:hypothetical protein
MPTDLQDVDTSGIELFFADNLEGETFYLRSASVYEAEEVREETGTETPEYGRWFPVHGATEDGETDGVTGWAVALGELVQEMQNAPGNPVEIPWTVTRCEKSGPEQTDPYEVNVVFHGGRDDEQAGLDSA